ncbi:MAG: translation initiation factor IF-2 subunit beta [ANME-2 cluster archaeon HR1]|nr:putative RNA-binding protein, contains TRAM domain [ANME-2 cluster archaeon]PPA80380.1 MAG: translation initiation factor IF-2 subunit beta [ANME-2 cluster archaeon HR1]
MYKNLDRSSPVEVGETYEVTIEDIAKEGDGIARVKGFVIFVPNTVVGEDVSIKISKIMRNFAFAEKVEE